MQNKKRIAFDMTEKALSDMDNLKTRLGLSTRTDLFNHAMTLLEHICNEIEAGNEPQIGSEVLTMPSFRNLKRKEE